MKSTLIGGTTDAVKGIIAANLGSVFHQLDSGSKAYRNDDFLRFYEL